MPHPPRPRLRRLLVLVTGVTTAAALSLGGATAANAAGNERFPAAKPSWAKSANDAGAAAADTTVEGEVFLDLKDQAGAESFAKSVSTPGSKTYGKYLSANAWIDRFSPSKSDFAAVVKGLKDAGFTITGSPKSRLFVVFRGPATTVDAAFAASLHRYRYRGRTLVAPSKTPDVPKAIASRISGIVLDQGRLLTRPSLAKPSVGAADAPSDTTPVALKDACSDYYGQNSLTLPEAYGRTSFPTEICGYTGNQFREAYDVPSGADGKGQTVAIIDAYASPTIVQDVTRLSVSRQQRPLTTYTQRVPSKFYDQAACGGPSGWQGEQTLDVQAVHNIAPNAGVLYVGGFNCGGGIDVALADILDNDRASIVTNSYGLTGEPPLYQVQGYENQHLQAVGEGIGLYYSSGDDGDVAAETGTPQPSYFASSPYVTSVGGSTLGIAKDGSVALETGWGTHRVGVVKDTATGAVGYAGPLPGAFRFGAGGGISTVFDQPWYQKGVVPSAYSTSRRVSPDISADADPYTGEVIGISPIVDDTTLKTGAFEEQTYGGTSLASPLFAAEVALVQQASKARLGFANPVLYGAYRKDHSVVRDVKSVQSAFAFTSPGAPTATPAVPAQTYLITNDLDTSLTTRNGYDDVTGLGSLSLDQLKRVAKTANR